MSGIGYLGFVNFEFFCKLCVAELQIMFTDICNLLLGQPFIDFPPLPSKQSELTAFAFIQFWPYCAKRLRGRRFRLAFRSRREQ